MLALIQFQGTTRLTTELSAETITILVSTSRDSTTFCAGVFRAFAVAFVLPTNDVVPMVRCVCILSRVFCFALLDFREQFACSIWQISLSKK